MLDFPKLMQSLFGLQKRHTCVHRGGRGVCASPLDLKIATPPTISFGEIMHKNDEWIFNPHCTPHKKIMDYPLASLKIDPMHMYEKRLAISKLLLQPFGQMQEGMATVPQDLYCNGFYLMESPGPGGKWQIIIIFWCTASIVVQTEKVVHTTVWNVVGAVVRTNTFHTLGEDDLILPSFARSAPTNNRSQLACVQYHEVI